MLCPTCGTNNAGGATSCSVCGSALGANPVTGDVVPYSPSLSAGTKLHGGHFTVGKVLGQGGFGITYKGGDMQLRRYVAIKEFFPFGCSRQASTVQPTGGMTAGEYQNVKAKFLEEARTLARFNHPGIVRVFATFEENNTAYMVMEYLEGKTLQEILELKGTLAEKDAVAYIEKVGEALEPVHAASLIHRDIKPDNILVTNDGRVVLIDFGTARQFASQKTVKQTAMLTPGYAPLEQYGSHARFGVYSDVYSLGATLYHCLTGQLPPQATDRATGVELRAPDAINPNVSPQVSRAVVGTLGLKAGDRFQSVGEFLRALKASPAPRSSTGVMPAEPTAWPVPQQAPMQAPQVPGMAPQQAPGEVALWVQRTGEAQVLTNATPDMAMNALRQAFLAVGVANVSLNTAAGTIAGDTGANLQSWGQRVSGQVSPSAQGTMILLNSSPKGQIVDWGRGKAEVQSILAAVEGSLRAGHASSMPGQPPGAWPAPSMPAAPPIPYPNAAGYGGYPGAGGGHMVNDSGQGKTAILPPHLRRFHWGALLMNWLWALSNGQVGLGLILLLICFIPLFGGIIALVIAIYLGCNGQELAWQGRRWDSVSHFEQVQKIWTNWGIGIFAGSLLLGFLGGLLGGSG